MSTRQIGTMKFFATDKAFGFVTPDAGGKDIFVHVSALEEAGIASLREGDRIAFEVEPDRSGRPKAARIELIERVAQ